MRHAFSLVELSIVLVILGLLTGGILTGQSLIRAAELRSVVTDMQRYQTAMRSFQDKYFAIPGDMRNATSFWGSAGGDGTNAACWDALTTAIPVCNGNGDGYPGSYAVTTLYRWSERMMAWKHLANAGLIEGSYIGKTDSTTNEFMLTGGKNVPASKIGTAVWDIYGRNGITGHATEFDDNGGIQLGLRSNGNIATAPLIPEEVWNIDTKLDDGKPGLGRVRTSKNAYTACATTDNAATAVYNVTDKSVNCALRMYIE
tara:strand:- start:352 stop:1125 length:774 start_codon:yes stop_codon:yes gene_type:complete